MSTKKKVLIGIGAFLGFILVVILVVFLTTGKERSLAEQFVTDISNGRTSDAYSQYSDALKKVQDQSTFEDQVSTLDLDSSCKLQISGVESSTSTTSGTIKSVSGTIKCDSKTLNTAEFKYNGDSKLIGFEIKP